MKVKMIIVMKETATDNQIAALESSVRRLGYQPHAVTGVERTVIGVIGDERNKEAIRQLVNLPGVDDIMPILKPYKLASRSHERNHTVVDVGGIKFGGDYFTVIAGPCSVETEDLTMQAAQAVCASGAHMLRGGAYKPRTSPYSFQGLAEDGLKILSDARAKTGLGIVTELISPDQTQLVCQYADILQIGARNMQNFSLLKEVGKTKKPVLLKRGLAATVEEWLMSAEYMMSEGNYHIILCERGIRTFETAYRNTLDLNAIPAVKGMTHLPVMVDPSHGTGRKDLIVPMSKAAIAAGADGLMVEVHPCPEQAFSDGHQSLTPGEFDQLMAEIRPFVSAVNKTLIHR